MTRKIAIIGGGIAGLGCAWLLSKHQKQFEISLFEKDDRLGGHVNTIQVNEDGKPLAIDTGFIVFNKVTYPNFCKLIDELQVAHEPTDMSFSVQHEPLNLEWSGTGLKRALAKKSNLFNPSFIRMVSNVGKFNRMCLNLLKKLESGVNNFETVQEASRNAGIKDELLDLYILPMMSSLWSATPEVVSKFPILQLAKFMHSHGLLSIYGKLQWYSIKGGSKTYVDSLVKSLPEGSKSNIHANTSVTGIRLVDGKVAVRTEKGESIFDTCIMACHADQALGLLPLQLSDERQILAKFGYSKNTATLHFDDCVMPSVRGNWASWNYKIKTGSISSSELRSSSHYWMNSLQTIASSKNYFVTLDSHPQIDSSKILTQIEYTHPVFTTDTLQAQEQLMQMHKDKSKQVFFAGSYHGFGFHEDALASSVHLCEQLLESSVA